MFPLLKLSTLLLALIATPTALRACTVGALEMEGNWDGTEWRAVELVFYDPNSQRFKVSWPSHKDLCLEGQAAFWNAPNGQGNKLVINDNTPLAGDVQEICYRYGWEVRRRGVKCANPPSGEVSNLSNANDSEQYTENGTQFSKDNTLNNGDLAARMYIASENERFGWHDALVVVVSVLAVAFFWSCYSSIRGIRDLEEREAAGRAREERMKMQKAGIAPDGSKKGMKGARRKLKALNFDWSYSQLNSTASQLKKSLNNLKNHIVHKLSPKNKNAQPMFPADYTWSRKKGGRPDGTNGANEQLGHFDADASKLPNPLVLVSHPYQEAVLKNFHNVEGKATDRYDGRKAGADKYSKKVAPDDGHHHHQHHHKSSRDIESGQYHGDDDSTTDDERNRGSNWNWEIQRKVSANWGNFKGKEYTYPQQFTDKHNLNKDGTPRKESTTPRKNAASNKKHAATRSTTTPRRQYSRDGTPRNKGATVTRDKGLTPRDRNSAPVEPTKIMKKTSRRDQRTMKRSRSSADLEDQKKEEKRRVRSLTPPRWDIDRQCYTTIPPKKNVDEIFKARAPEEIAKAHHVGMIMKTMKPGDVSSAYAGNVGDRRAEDVVGSWPI